MDLPARHLTGTWPGCGAPLGEQGGLQCTDVQGRNRCLTWTTGACLQGIRQSVADILFSEYIQEPWPLLQ
ncbi:hypothetical protein WJX73_010732 [Symbiochloris irregularis]|uniref:Uncharacterized protein n=1 Tax=Symbiochloris irregularis TaxID=706552 RepID=A0AAW1NQ12_9CHLO